MTSRHFRFLAAAAFFLLAFSQNPKISSQALAAKKKKPLKSLTPLYTRMAQDLAEKKPLVVTIYVTLCDNDTTILVKVPNEKLCHGEKPGSNIYWGTSGGLKTYLKNAGWKNLSYEKTPSQKLMARGLWKKTFVPGGELVSQGMSEPVDVVIVGLAYRGKMFKESLKDFLKAVHRDKALMLKDTALGDLAYGGRSHVVGYIGHDYFMNDEHYDELMSQAKGGSKLEKGVFALSCFGKHWIQPAVSRKNTHILLMNKSTTYPGAWAVGGLVRALTQGKDGAGIHQAAAEAFSEGKKMPLESILNAFSYGG